MEKEYYFKMAMKRDVFVILPLIALFVFVVCFVYDYYHPCPRWADYCVEDRPYVEKYGLTHFCDLGDEECYDELEDIKDGKITTNLMLISNTNACLYGCSVVVKSKEEFTECESACIRSYAGTDKE